MSTRTLVLTNVIHTVDNSAAVGVSVAAYLLVPGGGPATNVEGDVLFSGSPYGESTTTASDGSYSLTAVYPGDLTPTGCQLVVVEGTTVTLSPVGFSYSSSSTVSSWYPSASTSGTLAMLLDVHTVANAADQGVVIRFGISATAIDPNGNAINANRTIPVTTDSSGVATLNLYPSSQLNPATTTYFIAFPDGTIWYFLCPAHPTGYQGAYAGGTTYTPHSGTQASPADVVSSGGVYYQCILSTTGHTPPNATYWQVFPGEPVTWDLTLLTTPGGVVIGTSGVTASPHLAAVGGDPVNPATTLDDDLVNLVARAGLTLRTVTAGTTLLATDDYVLADATSGNVTLTLMASTARVRSLRIIRKDATANTVLISRAGSDTINGATSLALNTQYLWAVLQSDGAAAWYAQVAQGSGGSGSDATPTTVGVVEIDQAPASGHPVAVTTPRIGAANGVASLDATGLVPSAALPIATTALVGVVKPDGTSTTITTGGTLSVPVLVGAGASHAAGLVPDPGATPNTTDYLRRDGTWATPPGGGSGGIYAPLSNGNPASPCILNAPNGGIIISRVG